jgi:hypothetical protein
MAPQASKKCGLHPPDHYRIGTCTSNGIDSEQVPGTFSVLRRNTLTVIVIGDLDWEGTPE